MMMMRRAWNISGKSERSNPALGAPRSRAKSLAPAHKIKLSRRHYGMDRQLGVMESHVAPMLSLPLSPQTPPPPESGNDFR